MPGARFAMIKAEFLVDALEAPLNGPAHASRAASPASVSGGQILPRKWSYPRVVDSFRLRL